MRKGEEPPRTDSQPVLLRVFPCSWLITGVILAVTATLVLGGSWTGPAGSARAGSIVVSSQISPQGILPIPKPVVPEQDPSWGPIPISFALTLTSAYRSLGLTPEWVHIQLRQGYTYADMVIACELAARSGRAPGSVLAMAAAGRPWSSVAVRLGLGPQQVPPTLSLWLWPHSVPSGPPPAWAGKHGKGPKKAKGLAQPTEYGWPVPGTTVVLPYVRARQSALDNLAFQYLLLQDYGFSGVDLQFFVESGIAAPDLLAALVLASSQEGGAATLSLILDQRQSGQSWAQIAARVNLTFEQIPQRYTAVMQKGNYASLRKALLGEASGWARKKLGHGKGR